MREMKDSGIEWIGEVPENWSSTKIDALYSLRVEKVSDRDYPPLSVTMKGIVPQLETAAKTNDGDNRKLLRKGDFAINSRSDRRGSCGISQYDGSVSLINTVLKPRENMNSGYYNWLFHSTAFSDEFYRWGHGIVDDLWTTNWQDMKKIVIPVPPLNEQKKISDFLDYKCAEIDALTADIETQVETLEQYKRSVITEAVTKGLDPDAEMKDSGIKWVGKIPEQWVTIKTLYVLAMPITDGPHITPELYDEGIPFISAEAISSGKIDFNHIRGYISEDFYRSCCLKYIPKRNDIYMVKSGATTGRVAIVETDKIFTIWSPLAVFRADVSIIASRFLFYSIQSSYYTKQVEYEWSYGTQQNIGMRTLEKLKIVLPPMEEQCSIVAYLDQKCDEIDNIIMAKYEQLNILAEYKKSMIYEYVTGKKEVPGA